MKVAVYLIFLGGLVWGFYIVYQIVCWRYGEKIKAAWTNHWELKEANKFIQEQRNRVALAKYRKEYYCEVEDLEGWDEVVYNEAKTHGTIIRIDKGQELIIYDNNE